MSKLIKNLKKAQKNIDKTQKKINKILIKFRIDSKEANDKILKGLKARRYDSNWHKHLDLRLAKLYRNMTKQHNCQCRLQCIQSQWRWSVALIELDEIQE